MQLSSELQILWLLSVVAEAAVALRITMSGLGPRFGLFRAYLIGSILASLSAAFAYKILKSYYVYSTFFLAWVYLSTVFEFFVVQELCSHALAPFPAIRAASRRTLLGFWLVLIAVGGGWYYYLTLSPATKSPMLRAAIRYQDAAGVGFTLFIFLFLAFLAWMPVPLSRNQLIHSFLIGVLFLCTALSRFFTEFRNYRTLIEAASYIGLGGTLIVCLVWLYKIQPGEDTTLNTPKGPVNREEAEIMLERLSELNRTLERSGPRMLR